MRSALLRCVVVAMVASLTTVALAKPPRSLDPGTAEADTQAIVRSRGYSFCAKPTDPLPIAARDLCPLAERAPGCAALVDLCKKPPEPPPELSAFSENVLRALARIAPYVAWLLITALVGVVAYLVVRALRASKSEEMQDVILPASDVSIVLDAPGLDGAGAAGGALLLLQRAREARERGDARTALLTYLAAAIRALGDRGSLRISKERTNGEYVRSCQELPLRASLREIVREVDAVQFGGSMTTEAALSIAEARAAQIVGASVSSAASIATAVLGVMTIVMLGACDGRVGSHGNPAGTELLVDLLREQGAEIATVPASLANLPMQGETGPAVVLDLERVPLEAGTRAHLVAWVNQGGTLVLAGNPMRWPSDLWAKPLASTDSPGDHAVAVRVETRIAHAEDDDSLDAARRPARVYPAALARRTAMTWPSEDPAPRAIAKFDDGELYGALRTFGRGRVLGLASSDLLTNLGLAVPGNAAALVALLAALDTNEFAIARSEQGITPPNNPFAGLLHIGLGPALVHVLLFLPILFVAYGMRQTTPRAEPPRGRRAFAEHIRAVGGLYARRRAAKHALAVYSRHVDERVRAVMGRGTNPVQFLTTRADVDATFTADLYARALGAQGEGPPRGDELVDLQRLFTLFTKAMGR